MKFFKYISTISLLPTYFKYMCNHIQAHISSTWSNTDSSTFPNTYFKYLFTHTCFKYIFEYRFQVHFRINISSTCRNTDFKYISNTDSKQIHTLVYNLKYLVHVSLRAVIWSHHVLFLMKSASSTKPFDNTRTANGQIDRIQSTLWTTTCCRRSKRPLPTVRKAAFKARFPAGAGSRPAPLAIPPALSPQKVIAEASGACKEASCSGWCPGGCAWGKGSLAKKGASPHHGPHGPPG